MRLLHYDTIKIISNMNEIDFKTSTVSQRQVLSHAWSEVFKYIKTKQKHPKMFLSDKMFGVYAAYVYKYAITVGCKFNLNIIEKYAEINKEFYDSITEYLDYRSSDILILLKPYFDDIYLFSDCNSLYYKGLNIFKIVYPDNWRKYIPVESHKEIYRQITKTLNK